VGARGTTGFRRGAAQADAERAQEAQGAGAGVYAGSTCAVEQQHVRVRCWVTGQRHRRRVRALAESGAGPGRWTSAGVRLRLGVSAHDAGAGSDVQGGFRHVSSNAMRAKDTRGLSMRGSNAARPKQATPSPCARTGSA
jgi:hypothetical protein